jgi:hypothetical protein
MKHGVIKLILSALLVGNPALSNAGGSGEFFKFLEISDQNTLTLEVIEHHERLPLNRGGFGFKDCRSSLVKIHSKASWLRIFWGKLRGRQADWGDLNENSKALAYVRSLKSGDDILIDYIGSSVHHVDACTAEVRAWELHSLGIRAHRNY